METMVNQNLIANAISHHMYESYIFDIYIKMAFHTFHSQSQHVHIHIGAVRDF
jgi:hypothetical protein